jgi:hypothetical protein
MRSTSKRLAAVVFLVLGVGACAAPRNCLVIPAQIDLVKERREAALKDLETKANQVDRTRSSMEHVQERLKELQQEKAFLDSLPAPPEPAGKPQE